MPTPREAEVAAEHWLRSIGCGHTRRMLRAKWGKTDFFGADVVGFTYGGLMYFVQVTVGKKQAVNARRRKLEQYPWHPALHKVYVAQLIERQDPQNARRKQFFFRLHEYLHMMAEKNWDNAQSVVEIRREWFKTEGLK